MRATKRAIRDWERQRPLTPDQQAHTGRPYGPVGSPEEHAEYVLRLAEWRTLDPHQDA